MSLHRPAILFAPTCPALRLPFRFSVLLTFSILGAALLPVDFRVAAQAQEPPVDLLATEPARAAQLQQELLTDIRQLTFDGKRAGEGYLSRDGKLLVFQSEREAGNPFFQIYLMDRENGDIERVSPGLGKTTCAWIHPDNQQVLFASTQYDPQAQQKQLDEIAFRESGQTRRYSWDYDPSYDLVVFNRQSQQYEQLTTAVGYDAEGSYSPDGQWICFASNRRAYSGELSEEEQRLFEIDPSSAMDLYIMRSDGSQLKRLTTEVGYDGGPFFSPDGQQICFRRFSRDGATAEIMLMHVDGTEQRALTKLGNMSWAPFFHPSGDYLIFATNRHGFGNFELYLVDALGAHEPARVTYREGFDGLPVFTTDGQGLLWTSNGGNSQSQIFEAEWNDAAARKLLGLDRPASESPATSPNSSAVARESARLTAPGFSAADIGRHVDYLCRPELGGRLTGTQGEINATAYVAAFLESLGLQPAGDQGTFFHEFEFISDVELGPKNSLQVSSQQENQAEKQQSFRLEQDWRPVFFSQEGEIDPTAIVFAGYGIVAPSETANEAGKAEDSSEYDSYVHLDVTDKWVLVFRQMPQDISPQRRQHLARYSSARYKAMVARDRGAKGLIFVSGPNSPLRQRLIPLEMDGTLGSSSLAVVSVSDALASDWMELAGENLKDLQTGLDTGEMAMGFQLESVKLSATIDIQPVTSRGRNVLALLSSPSHVPAANTNPHAVAPREMIVIGAHIDHLGNGAGGGSLAKEEERGGVHRGADDNASGVAGMLEIAQYLADEISTPGNVAKRDILFAAWSGEELGLRGSQAFADDFDQLFPMRSAHPPHATASDQADPHAQPSGPLSLYPQISANINLDMIGRLRDNLVLQGIGSSPYWTGAIERRNAVVRLPLALQNDCHLPTDASTFFLHGVPILSAFTGSHEEYHTPRDVPELLNYEGAAQVARLMALVARDLLLSEKPPAYQEQTAQPEMRANLTAYLGTIPDYAQTDVKGVKLSGVTKGAPAELAGMQSGDVIIELAGRKIENIYDYTYAIEALKVGQATTVKVNRGGQQLELPLTPASRK
jgi:Tol biopolymer transport system component